MAAIPTFIGMGTWTTTISGDATVDFHASTAIGDTIIVMVETANEAVATPSGWTSAYTPTGTGTAALSGSVRLYVFYRVYDGTFASVAIPNGGDHSWCISFTVSGVAWVFAEVASTQIDTPGTTAISCPTGTTTTANCLIAHCIATAHDAASAQKVTGWANANLANVTERYDNCTDTNAGGGLWLCTGELATAGAIGTTTATATGGWKHEYLTLALVPGTTLTVSKDNVLLPDLSAKYRDLNASDPMFMPDSDFGNEDKLLSDSMFAPDWMTKVMDKPASDAVLFADIVARIQEKVLKDQALLADARFSALDKFAIEQVLTADVAVKALEMVSPDSIFLYDAGNLIRVLESLSADSFLLADSELHELVRDLLYSDNMLTHDERTSTLELSAVSRVLLDSMANRLREILNAEGFVISDVATTNLIVWSVSALVWARIATKDLLGVSHSHADDFLGIDDSHFADFLGVSAGWVQQQNEVVH